MDTGEGESGTNWEIRFDINVSGDDLMMMIWKVGQRVPIARQLVKVMEQWTK